MSLVAPMIKAVLLLPVMVVIVIPGVLLWLTGGIVDWGLGDPYRWFLLVGAVLLTTYGLWMAYRTCTLFLRVGRGTPAPWDPPQQLVIEGPYRYVRNPMMSSVFALLGAECLVLGCVAIVGWTVFFIVLNTIYIPLSEEPALEKRFGEAYREYKRDVPRWIPRMSAYDPSDGGSL